jgi:thiosulfate dehydrogenase
MLKLKSRNVSYKNIRLNSILIPILLTFTQAGMASDLGETLSKQGNTKGATACVACHGVNGGGLASAGFPRLSGLEPAYIEKQLQDFANEKRGNAVMKPIAQGLSDDEIKAVATYYSQLEIPSSTQKPATDDATIASFKEGKQLAINGNWSKNIPACYACHGEGAGGIGENFPALAGQGALYIEQQLNAWRNGQRKNDPNDLMKGVALRLSDAEIKSVSAYLASLSSAWH